MADDNKAADAGAANQDPAGQQQNNGNNAGSKMLTQAEIDAIVEERLARDRKSRDAELKELKSKAGKWDEAEKAKLSEIEKLKLDLTEKDKSLAELQGKLKTHELQAVKLQKLTEAGITPDWLDSVFGETEEDIQKSVERLAARLKVTPPTAAQGAGQTGVQNAAQGQKKVWTQAEIRELRTSGKMTDELHAEIIQATKEGRVQ